MLVYKAHLISWRINKRSCGCSGSKTIHKGGIIKTRGSVPTKLLGPGVEAEQRNICMDTVYSCYNEWPKSGAFRSL